MNTINLSSAKAVNQVNPFAQWMMRFLVAMLLVGGLSMVTAQQSSVHAQETIYHTVRSGETMSSIARRYGVNANTLASYNGITNPNLLRPGQVLRIPSTTQAAPVQPQPQSAPQPQNTPTRPAPAQSVTPTQPQPPVVYPTPTPTRPVTSPRYYTVRANDTLYGIAARYGASVAAIKVRNGLSSDLIYVGQRLVIP
jgi:LysM repeat protein